MACRMRPATLSTCFVRRSHSETIAQHPSHKACRNLRQSLLSTTKNDTVTGYIGQASLNLLALQANPQRRLREHGDHQEKRKLMMIRKPKRVQKRGDDSYGDAIIDRISSLMGQADIDRRKLRTQITRKQAEFFQNPDERLLDSWIAKLDKYSRRLPLFELWLLDYHVIADMDFIIRKTNYKPAQAGGWDRLRGHLILSETNMKNMKGASRLPHVVELMEERKHLFAVAQTLQGLEPKWKDQKRSRRRLVTLSGIRDNLLQAQTLSTELITKNALLAGLGLQKQTLLEFKKRGHHSHLTAQPEAEAEINVD
ncbi:hypothetical protein GGR57DRAFT_323881 [Xylariaceae sp. FL1272]|nr:hypothetical protein GGR57DRAFT_323881 [Xylariaceae sp. FL1272]